MDTKTLAERAASVETMLIAEMKELIADQQKRIEELEKDVYVRDAAIKIAKVVYTDAKIDGI